MKLIILEQLVNEGRVNVNTDVEFAERIALVYCNSVALKDNPLATIRTAFRIH